MTDSPPYPGMPLWVKAFGIAALIAVALFVVLHLAGGGIAQFGAHDHGLHGHAPANASGPGGP